MTEKESRAIARKPRDAPVVRFGLMFADIHTMALSWAHVLGPRRHSVSQLLTYLAMALSWAHSYLPFTLLLSPTLLNPTIYSSTNMQTIHNSSLLSRQ